MGLLEKVVSFREKANRLGVDTDGDQRRQDRDAEARGRLDAGRQTLTAIMDGHTEQLRARVSALAGQSEAVGKLTQVMADIAPALRQHTAELQHVVQQIDSAKAELGAAGQLPRAAARVETAMGTLLERANLPAGVMPRDVLADLVHDATEDNPPRTEPNADVPAQPSASASASPVRRGRLRDVTRKTAFLDAFRAPSDLGSIVSAATSRGGVFDRAAPSAATGGNEHGASSALGVLGGAARALGVDTGPVSIDRDGVSLTGGGDHASASLALGADGDAAVSGELAQETPVGAASLSAGASRLRSDLQTRMEASLGADFSSVRIHENSAKAHALGAEAYAHGEELHFARGSFNPGTSEGDALIGHELAHVVQQRAGRVAAPQGDDLLSDAGLEHEADLAGYAAAQGDRAEIASAAGASLSVRPGAAPKQPKLRGTQSAFQAGARAADKPDPLWSKLVSAIGAYEQAEATYEALSTQAGKRSRIEPGPQPKNHLSEAHKQDLLGQLQAIQALAESYLSAHARELAYAPGADQTQDAYRAQQTSPEGRSMRDRGHLIHFLLPRLKQERADLASDTWSERSGALVLRQANAASGEINKVDRVERDGVEGFYKPDVKRGLGAAGSALGIGHSTPAANGLDPGYAARSVASSVVDELLGANVTAHTEFAARGEGSNATMGTFQHLAPGVSPWAAKFTNAPFSVALNADHQAASGRGDGGVVNLSDGNLQRSLNVLQILDAITGQLDRHWNNYLISPNADGSAKAVGIDLDMAFAPNHKGVDAASGGRSSHFVGLPDVFDASFAQQVLDVKPPQLEAALAPLLSPAEVSATLVRLDLVQKAIGEASKRDGAFVSSWDAATSRKHAGKNTYNGEARDALVAAMLSQMVSPIDALNKRVAYAVSKALRGPAASAETAEPLAATCRAIAQHLSTDPGWQALSAARAAFDELYHRLVLQYGEWNKLPKAVQDASQAARTASTDEDERWATAAAAAALAHYSATPTPTKPPTFGASPDAAGIKARTAGLRRFIHRPRSDRAYPHGPAQWDHRPHQWVVGTKPSPLPDVPARDDAVVPLKDAPWASAPRPAPTTDDNR